MSYSFSFSNHSVEPVDNIPHHVFEVTIKIDGKEFDTLQVDFVAGQKAEIIPCNPAKYHQNSLKALAEYFTVLFNREGLDSTNAVLEDIELDDPVLKEIFNPSKSDVKKNGANHNVNRWYTSLFQNPVETLSMTGKISGIACAIVGAVLLHVAQEKMAIFFIASAFIAVVAALLIERFAPYASPTLNK